jgi:hypothetical protein
MASAIPDIKDITNDKHSRDGDSDNSSTTASTSHSIAVRAAATAVAKAIAAVRYPTGLSHSIHCQLVAAARYAGLRDWEIPHGVLLVGDLSV